MQWMRLESTSQQSWWPLLVVTQLFHNLSAMPMQSSSEHDSFPVYQMPGCTFHRCNGLLERSAFAQPLTLFGLETRTGAACEALIASVLLYVDR